MKVQYEWDRETVDSHGDIVDHNHSEKLAHIIEDKGALVLVRDEYTEENGVEHREWAYVEGGKLPENFEDAFGKKGSRVPQRYHKELARFG